MFHVGSLFHAERELVMGYCYVYDQFKIGCTYDQLIIGCAYDQFKIGCVCDQFIIGQIDHFKLVENATKKVLVKTTNI